LGNFNKKDNYLGGW